MNKALPWLVTSGLLLAAWLVAWVTPPEDAGEQPFTASITLGEHAEGRNLAVTVTAVQAARSLSGSQGWSIEGDWIVFDLEAAAVISAERASIRGATLEVDGLTYRATERLDSLLQRPLMTGAPLQGTLAFEVAPFVLEAEEARLLLSLNADPRSDSQFVLTLSPRSLPVAERAEIIPTDWARK